MSDPSLLPPNATPQERALSLALARLGEIPVELSALWHPATCPLPLLPWLAWALSVDDWRSDWSEAVKREACARALELHRKKGTPWAVEYGLVVSGAPNAVVREWWEYEGDPYHFQVEIDLAGEAVSGDLETRLLATIAAQKNARSVLDALVYNLACEGDVPALAPGLQSSERVTLWPP